MDAAVVVTSVVVSTGAEVIEAGSVAVGSVAGSVVVTSVVVVGGVVVVVIILTSHMLPLYPTSHVHCFSPVCGTHFP